MTRTRWILLGGCAALAFAIGIARGLREEPPAPEPMHAATEPSTPPPPTAPPPTAPSASPEAAAPSDPRREAIRAKLAADLDTHFPELKLSSDEVDAAADALMRLRAARLELDALPRTPDNGERVHELVREIGRAYEDFEYVIELDPAEFTERVDPGIDPDEEEGAE
jgi:hypothetical protein